MVRITEELIRKRAEHNEGEIFTLEELSLHQQNIEKIEFLDKWCKDLKILYLQSNLISKIENVGRLKKLEYLNLALNNIEIIENLQGCEFLNKLDLTVNFIGELTSVENLTENYHLKELYLTGNPCTEYEGYREYVISTLPQLKMLDGVEIKKSDRIKALQNYKQICNKIIEKQNEYFKLRMEQKKKYEEIKKEKISEIDEEKFWSEKTDYTPESRWETYRVQEEIKRKNDTKTKHQNEDLIENNVMKRRFFSEDGKPYSFNDPKVDYTYDGDNDESIILTVHVFKHMDSSLIDVDVQPNYVRITLKGKSLQLALSEEVKPDSSTAKRSLTTGHLEITMPKINQIIRPKKVENQKQNENEKVKVKEIGNGNEKSKKSTNTYLEFDDADSKKNKIDLANIYNESLNNSTKNKTQNFNCNKLIIKQRENSPDFVDDSSVPPLD